jgi:hypothetical protein
MMAVLLDVLAKSTFSFHYAYHLFDTNPACAWQDVQ